MSREELESKLQEVFFNALNGDGVNYPVRIKLNSGAILDGFKIIENNPNYILGLTEPQRRESVGHMEYFNATYLRKNSISDLTCPELDVKNS